MYGTEGESLVTATKCCYGKLDNISDRDTAYHGFDEVGNIHRKNYKKSQFQDQS